MRKTDLATRNRLGAFRHPLQLLADRDQVGGGSVRLVAVEADPVDRRGVALLVVLIGAGEASRNAGGTEVEQVLLVEDLLELGTDFSVTRRTDVLRREHINRLPNRRSYVNRFDRENARQNLLSSSDPPPHQPHHNNLFLALSHRHLQPPKRRLPTPPSQSFF